MQRDSGTGGHHFQVLPDALHQLPDRNLFPVDFHVLQLVQLPHRFGVLFQSLCRQVQIPCDALCLFRADLPGGQVHLEIFRVPFDDRDGIAQVMGDGCLHQPALFQHVPQGPVVFGQLSPHGLERAA